MIKQTIRNGIRTGAIFGVIIIFLVLIGFNNAAVDLIGNILK